MKRPEIYSVTTINASYPIMVGDDVLRTPSLWQPFLKGKQVFIISSATIAQHYLKTLEQTCRAVGITQIDHHLLTDGEQHKTLAAVQSIWEVMLQQHHDRTTTVIALGGGMIGDVAGFAAACYLRGVALIQCPTTLLAQVDAAIGGKTAVNLPQAKNCIGAFYAPTAVFTDLITLKTLPEREYVAGLAEVIKYGMVLDETFFTWIEQSMPLILQRHPNTMAQMISWSTKLKSQVVSTDEKELQQRIILNFGHTVAHALESVSGYQQWLHGEAVAIGMIIATQLSIQLGLISAKLLERLVALLNKANLPTSLPSTITVVEILSKMKHDKKHAHQKLRWVLLNDLGRAHVTTDVALDHIVTALSNCGARA